MLGIAASSLRMQIKLFCIMKLIIYVCTTPPNFLPCPSLQYRHPQNQSLTYFSPTRFGTCGNYFCSSIPVPGIQLETYFYLFLRRRLPLMLCAGMSVRLSSVLWKCSKLAFLNYSWSFLKNGVPNDYWIIILIFHRLTSCFIIVIIWISIVNKCLKPWIACFTN